MYFDRNHIYWNSKREILPSSLPKKWGRGLPHHEELKIFYLSILWAGISFDNTATCYKLAGPGTHPASYTIGTGSFQG